MLTGGPFMDPMAMMLMQTMMQPRAPPRQMQQLEDPSMGIGLKVFEKMATGAPRQGINALMRHSQGPLSNSSQSVPSAPQLALEDRPRHEEAVGAGANTTTALVPAAAVAADPATTADLAAPKTEEAIPPPPLSVAMRACLYVYYNTYFRVAGIPIIPTTIMLLRTSILGPQASPRPRQVIYREYIPW